MSARIQTQCPGCGGRRLSAAYCIRRQPAVLNYRFPSIAGALRVKRKDIRLVQCRSCGLIFNAAFDIAAIPYDENYENRQCFSPAFQTHLNSLADDLIQRYALRGKRILEVGCGKGDFLRLICRRAKARGDGYDTSYEGPIDRSTAKVRFHRQYVSAGDIRQRYDAIICRHVVEHIGEIGAFLRELHAVARAAGDPVVVIETPSFEWIAAQVSFWDIFYEHCNYFSLRALARLAELAGFEILTHRTVFGEQYQLLEMRARRLQAARPAVLHPSLAVFARRAETQLQRLERKIIRAGAKHGWAIWGAGAKGVALVSRLKAHISPDFVIDSNPAKQGCVIPGSRVRVISPGDPRIKKLSLILVANPNYLPEISFTLRKTGFANTIFSA